MAAKPVWNLTTRRKIVDEEQRNIDSFAQDRAF
jgi:hypothetical protein